MANAYGPWTTGIRLAAGAAWKQLTHASAIFRGVDQMFQAFADMGVDADNSDTFGLWTHPLRFGGATGGYIWWSVADGGFRVKGGSAPAAEDEGELVGVGGIV